MLQRIVVFNWMWIIVLYGAAICQMLEYPITISDGVNTGEVVIGVHPDGSDDFDPGLDLLSPPPPPSGVFDARLRVNFVDLVKDIRESTTAEKEFCLLYQAQTGRTITLIWDPALAASLGSMVLTDKFGGDQFMLDMTMNSTLEVGNDPAILDGVRIALIPDFTVGIPTEETDAGDQPEHWQLRQNFPNPFNGVTGISYTVPQAGWVEVSIFNAAGQHVRTLIAAIHQKGQYHLQWDGRSNNGEVVTTGVYVYRLFANGFSGSKRLVFIK